MNHQDGDPSTRFCRDRRHEERHDHVARATGAAAGRLHEPPQGAELFQRRPDLRPGWDWYSSLFRRSQTDDLRGESSTHYTKLPTYPRTVERMARDLPRLKLIYLMRHPIDRLISQYVHELTTGRIKVGVLEAIRRHPELIDYSRYAMQLQPFLDAYGFANVLPVFFTRLVNHSQGALERIGRFLGHDASLHWDTALKPQNAGRDRLRHSPMRRALVQAPVLSVLRRRVVPHHWSQSLKDRWRARSILRGCRLT